MINYKEVSWYHYQGALLPRVPPHQEIFLTQKESRELLKKVKHFFYAIPMSGTEKRANFGMLSKIIKKD